MEHAVKLGKGLPENLAQYVRFNGWPELKESLMAGRIKAAYFLAPLAMDLADKGLPLRIVTLGHRSGAVVMVKTDSPAKSMSDLRGRRIAVRAGSPSTTCSCAVS